MEHMTPKWSAIELSNDCRKAKTEVTFMTDKKQNMAGLTATEAKRLQEQYGKNELTARKKESSYCSLLLRPFILFWENPGMVRLCSFLWWASLALM
jgi:magnesium-transporting ATPase (P-type)